MKEYILPVRDLVVHPGLAVPVYVDNPLSVACIEAATNNHQRVVLCPQHTWGYPTSTQDLFNTGTIGDIVQALHMPDGAIHLIIRTTNVVELSNIENADGIFSGDISVLDMLDDSGFDQTIALRDKVMDAMQMLSSRHKFKTEKFQAIVKNYPMSAFVDSVMQTANIDVEMAVNILRMKTWHRKLMTLLEQIMLLIETDKIEANINRRVQNQMENGQRQAILQEKMRAIQKEMGEGGDEIDTSSLRKQIENSAMSAEAKEKAMSEFKRMRAMSPMSQ